MERAARRFTDATAIFWSDYKHVAVIERPPDVIMGRYGSLVSRERLGHEVSGYYVVDVRNTVASKMVSDGVDGRLCL